MLLVSCPKFFPTQSKLARALIFLAGGNGFPRLVYSAIQQHASAASAHVPPPATHPTGLGHHRARSSRAGQPHPSSTPLYTWWCTHISANSLSSSHPLLPLHCSQVPSLCLCLYSCPAKRSISTIFLDSIYTC